MWIKFSILMLVAVINVALSFIIWKRNKNKDKARLYFSLMCFSAGLWSISLGLMFLDVSIFFYTLSVKGNYIFSTCIFIFFMFFCSEFLYKVKNKILNYLALLLFLTTLPIIFTNFLFKKIYFYEGLLRYDPNLIMHLLYGFFFLLIFFYSYHILFLKYKNSQGINQSRILLIIIGTLISFIFGIYFDWVVLYVNQYHLFWIGPVFMIIMNSSVAYLLFKKENE